jgi:ubiquitin-conjugating enzyme E2 J1
LSFSAYHPELWQPAWGIRLILEALISFLPTPADGAIGALDWSSAERKKLATKSLDYCCPRCGKAVQLLPKPASTERKSSSASRFQKEIERLHQLQWEHEGKRKAEEMEKAEENNDAVKGEIEGGKSNNEEQNNSVVEVKGSDHTADYVKDKEDGVASNERMKAPELKTEEQSKDVDTMPERHSDDDKKVEAAANKELEINNTLHQEPAAETTPVAAVSSTTITATTAEVAEANNTNNATVVVAHSEQFWLIDPALQCTVVLLAIICYMLIRKGHALYEEIRRLD